MKQGERKKTWFAEVSSSGYLSGVKSESNSLQGDSARRYSSSWRFAAWQLRGVGWRGGEMASGGGKGLRVSNIYRPHWKRRSGDEGIRAKLMVIFYSGSPWSTLSNTVITSLVRGEREKEGKKRDSSLCHGRKWTARLNWVVTSEAVVLTLQRDGEMEGERAGKRREVLIRPFVFVSLLLYPSPASHYWNQTSYTYTEHTHSIRNRLMQNERYEKLCWDWGFIIVFECNNLRNIFSLC